MRARGQVSGAPRGKGRQCPAPDQLSLGDTRQRALSIYDSDGLMGWGVGGSFVIFIYLFYYSSYFLQ